MSKSVYIVTEGEYSSYRIRKVFSEKQLANTYAELIDGLTEEFSYSDEEISTSLKETKITTYYRGSLHRYYPITYDRSLKKKDLWTWFQEGGDLYREETQKLISKKPIDEYHFHVTPIHPLAENVNKLNELSSACTFKTTPNDGMVLSRTVCGEENKHKVEEKPLRDLFYHCLSLYKEHEWSIEMINDWLDTKI